MTHEKIRLNAAGSAPSAAMYTYFLDLSPEVPVQKRPTVIVCPGGGYAFTSDREAEPIALRLNAAGLNAVVVRYSVAPARFPTALLESRPPCATCARRACSTAATPIGSF